MTYGMGNVLVNPYLFSMMGPYGYVSNWGDSIQFNVMPSYFSPMQASLTHGILNPNHVSQWDPMFSIPMSANTTNPILTQQGAQIATNWGSENFHGALAQIKISDIKCQLNSSKNSFKTLLENKKLNDNQKQQIKQTISEIEALEKKLTQLVEAKAKSQTDNKTFCDEIKKIENETDKLVKTASTTYSTILKEVKSEAEKPENTTQTTEQTQQEEQVQQPQTQQAQQQQPAQQTQQPQQTQQAEQTQQTPQQATEEAPAVVPSVKRYHQEGYATSPEAQAAGKEYADAIYEAVDPNFGTDKEALEKAIECINKYTVMETLDAWNKTKAEEFGGESMLESIYDDVFWGDDRTKYTVHILTALVERAMMENIDISAEANAVIKELDAWWRDDEKIFKLINEIHKSLGGKEYKEY